jgi:hypothetical protein
VSAIEPVDDQEVVGAVDGDVARTGIGHKDRRMVGVRSHRKRGWCDRFSGIDVGTLDIIKYTGV